MFGPVKALFQSFDKFMVLSSGLSDYNFIVADCPGQKQDFAHSLISALDFVKMDSKNVPGLFRKEPGSLCFERKGWRMASSRRKRAGGPGTVGQNIKYFRKQRKMTQDDLAEAVGYNNGTAVSRMEHGEFAPSLEKLEKIAQVLNVSVPELTGEQENEEVIKSSLRQEAFDELNTLFSLSSKATPEQMREAIHYLRNLTKENDSSDTDD